MATEESAPADSKLKAMYQHTSHRREEGNREGIDLLTTLKTVYRDSIYPGGMSFVVQITAMPSIFFILRIRTIVCSPSKCHI